ncbi:uncharacterized protein B0T23DRAFT_394577 [Neurospora hispaniola]|uniref:Uncharacterized protein n=1 Tax=Neurospora hispaniola TaxID=588809 RepID=A0AAJ0MS86_9PEZI|nr:hypothetical protein B0T23DRAFT_394577 [Neurospora hispaniola]
MLQLLTTCSPLLLSLARQYPHEESQNESEELPWSEQRYRQDIPDRANIKRHTGIIRRPSPSNPTFAAQVAGDESPSELAASSFRLFACNTYHRAGLHTPHLNIVHWPLEILVESSLSCHGAQAYFHTPTGALLSPSPPPLFGSGSTHTGSSSSGQLHVHRIRRLHLATARDPALKSDFPGLASSFTPLQQPYLPSSSVQVGGCHCPALRLKPLTIPHPIRPNLRSSPTSLPAFSFHCKTQKTTHHVRPPEQPQKRPDPSN